MSPIFQVWGSAPAQSIPPVFRAVLLHTEASGQRLLRLSVHTPVFYEVKSTNPKCVQWHNSSAWDCTSAYPPWFYKIERENPRKRRGRRVTQSKTRLVMSLCPLWAEISLKIDFFQRKTRNRSRISFPEVLGLSTERHCKVRTVAKKTIKIWMKINLPKSFVGLNIW